VRCNKMLGRERANSTSSGASKDDDKAQILATLSHGQSALRKLQWRFGACWLCLCAVAAVAYYQLDENHAIDANHEIKKRIFGMWQFVVDFVLELLFEARLVLPMLAPLEDNMVFLRCVLVFEATFFCFVRTRLVLDLIVDDSWQDFLLKEQIDTIVYLARGYASVAYVLWVMAWRRTPQGILQGLRVAMLMYSVLNILHTLFLAGVKTQWWGEVPANLIAIYVVLWPKALQICQARLRRWMETRGATRAAAAIACLVGMVEPKKVMQQAEQRFRSIDLSKLSSEDLWDNAPDPRLNALAEPTKLGSCDAFVSHSWHDDAAAKWEALQEWRSWFRAKHGREPRVWLDKLCIDQNNIEADLRCLPVSLSGCKSLLVLYGPTYLSRLWCVIEIFTYIMMGGGVNDIDVRLVLREEHADEDRTAMVSAFEGFDVAQCQCHRSADKERILLVIGTAFGILGAFNQAVVEVLGQIQTDSVVKSLSLVSADNV